MPSYSSRYAVSGRQYRPVVPEPYDVLAETEKVRVPEGWFQHWSVLNAQGKKLKGGIMVRHFRDNYRIVVTTYRDGVHVQDVNVNWLLTVQS